MDGGIVALAAAGGRQRRHDRGNRRGHERAPGEQADLAALNDPACLWRHRPAAHGRRSRVATSPPHRARCALAPASSSSPASNDRPTIVRVLTRRTRQHAHGLRLPEVERDRGRGSCDRPATAGLPSSASAPAGRPTRRCRSSFVAAMGPVAVGEVGRADVGLAFAVGAVTGGAVRREHGLAGLDIAGRTPSAAGQAQHIGDDVLDIVAAPASGRGRTPASATRGCLDGPS